MLISGVHNSSIKRECLMETHSADSLGKSEYQQLSYCIVHKGFILFNTYQQVINMLSTNFNSSLSSAMLLAYQSVNFT